MAAFDLALSQVRDGSDHLLSPGRINQLARERRLVFRNTRLTPGETLSLFARQIAHGNIACSAVHHLAGVDFSDTAWCQARQRLPMELIEQVHRQLIDQTRAELDQTDDAGDGQYRWRGLSGNWKVISTAGEGYTHKRHCMKMARDLHPDAEIVVVEHG